MKLIKESKLKRLLADSELLARLNAMGVNNWTDYTKAICKNINYDKI